MDLPTTERRIEELLAQMTLEEKIGQLVQAPNSEAVDAEAIREGRVGTMISANSAYAGNDDQARVRAAALNAIQRIAVEESRLRIPVVFARDVIHGHRTVFPIPLGQSCAWNPDLVREGAEVAAREARADGIHWTFTPMLDIARDPRWGRIAEGFGEDPWLASRLAEAAVRGYEGTDVAAPDRMAACAKHFVGYGAAEGGRDYNTAEISWYTMRNVYLRPFAAAARAGVRTFMASFNEIGGRPVTSDRHLLTETLREQWDWNGTVVSDWGAVGELVHHGIAEDQAHAGRLALTAGVDIDMASPCYPLTLAGEVRAGRVGEEVVDEAVRRVLRLKADLGLFERPYTDESLADRVQLTDAHRALARRAAAESAILLKNDGLLPLENVAERTLGVVGPLAGVRDVLFGTWTLDGEGRDVPPIHEAFRQSGAKRVIAVDLADDALNSCRWADVIVCVLGESAGRSGEDNCVTDLGLPPGQVEFLEALRKLGKPIVTVVVAGRPLVLDRVLAASDAVLFSFHPGVEGGGAIVDLLTGVSSPQGRTTVSFPRATGQVPIHYNHKATGRPLTDAEPRTRLLDSLDSPQFPFGFGLTYGRVEYGSTTAREEGETIVVRNVVKNTGPRACVEIVQCYLRDVASNGTRPVQELVGFQHVPLVPGEERSVEFRLTRKDLAFWNLDDVYGFEPGEFRFWVAPHARTEEPAVLRLT